MAGLPPKPRTAYKALGRRLRQAREEAGLTQTAASELIGRPQSFIAKCEAGERRMDIIELGVLSRLYGKSLDYFDLSVEAQ